MVVKVAMADHFQFKVMPSIKNFCLLKQGDVHYIGGTDILPAPLGASEEQNAIEALGTCLLYTSPSPRDGLLSRMPSSA